MKTQAFRAALIAALALCAPAMAQNAPPLAAAAPSASDEPAADAPTAAAPAAPPPASAPAAVAQPAAPASAISANLTPPPAGRGQVVFFRPKQFMGAAISFKVREGETELGRLSFGTYFVAVLEPGVHVFKVHSEAKDELTLEIEAGETYYVSTSMSMGVALYRPNMTPSNQAAFDAVFSKIKMTSLEPSTVK